jgi:hypothetical protein
MKDLEKVSAMLKQFIEESMVEASKLDKELEAKKIERDAKYKEIDDVLAQMDYLDIIKSQLEQKLELLEEERAKLDLEIDEKELTMKRNKLDNTIDEIDYEKDLFKSKYIEEGE